MKFFKAKETDEKTKKKVPMKKVGAAGLAGVLGLVCAFGPNQIGAYFSDTKDMTNNFTTGSVHMDITENVKSDDGSNKIISGWDPSRDGVDDDDPLRDGKPDIYEMIPEMEVPKAPKITNTGKNACYAFMSVTVPYEDLVIAEENGTRQNHKDVELFSYDINPGWVEIKLAEDNGGIDGHSLGYKFVASTSDVKAAQPDKNNTRSKEGKWYYKDGSVTEMGEDTSVGSKIIEGKKYVKHLYAWVGTKTRPNIILAGYTADANTNEQVWRTNPNKIVDYHEDSNAIGKGKMHLASLHAKGSIDEENGNTKETYKSKGETTKTLFDYVRFCNAVEEQNGVIKVNAGTDKEYPLEESAQNIVVRGYVIQTTNINDTDNDIDGENHLDQAHDKDYKGADNGTITTAVWSVLDNQTWKEQVAGNPANGVSADKTKKEDK